MSSRLTPVRVHRVVSSLLAHLGGTSAKAPKPCGVGRLEGPKAASLAEPNATRRSKQLPEWVKRANTRGFAIDIKLITKPLMVKTQAKESQKQIGGSKPSHLGDPLRQFLLVELVCCSV
jgi:hypothetical protein